MSGLWQQILRGARIAGNHSGCHQLPERSFFYKGKQFPVCARCTGVFIGQLMALVYGIRHRLKRKSAILFLGIMGIDWGLQELGMIESTNKRRLFTGFCGGFGLVSFYILFLKYCREVLLRWRRNSTND